MLPPVKTLPASPCSARRAPARALDLWLRRQAFWSAVARHRFVSTRCKSESGVKPPHSKSSQRLISQIQQSSRCRHDLSFFHLEIDATDIDAALADLKNDRVFAVGIFLQDRFIHERVGM